MKMKAGLPLYKTVLRDTKKPQNSRHYQDIFQIADSASTTKVYKNSVENKGNWQLQKLCNNYR